MISYNELLTLVKNKDGNRFSPESEYIYISVFGMEIHKG